MFKLILFTIIYMIITLIIGFSQSSISWISIPMMILIFPIVAIWAFILRIKNQMYWAKVEKENHDNLEKIAKNTENADN